jgi:hypothetical protein
MKSKTLSIVSVLLSLNKNIHATKGARDYDTPGDRSNRSAQIKGDEFKSGKSGEKKFRNDGFYFFDDWDSDAVSFYYTGF